MKKYLIPVLLLTLGLASCKQTPSESSKTTNESSEQNTVVNKWPAEKIAEYLSDYDISLTVPGLVLESEPEVYYIDNDPDFDPYLAIYAYGDDRAEEYADILETANYEIDEFEDEDGPYYNAYDEEGYVLVQFYFTPADEEDDACMEFYISALVEDDDDNDSDGGYEEKEVFGWPEKEIADFLEIYNLSSIVVPSVSLDSEFVISYIVDDPEYGTYLEIYIPYDDIGEQYIALLEAANYLVQEDEYGVFAYDESYHLMVEVYFTPEDDDYFGETLIYLTVLLEGGDVDEPVNPENGAVFNFATDSQITGGKNKNKTTWTANGTTMVIEKHDSTVDVGNENDSKPLGFWSDPLRIYKGQKVTFTAPSGLKITQVVLKTVSDTAKGINSSEVFMNSAPSNAKVSVSGDIVTYTFATPVSSFSLVMVLQGRLSSATISYN